MSEPNTDSVNDVPRLIERWRQGDQEAATLLFDRYQQRLLLLVSGHLNGKLKRRLDAEEVVDSIMRSAFRVTSERDIGCENETGFWKWLVTVALNKTFKRIDRETAAKRDPGRETGGDTVLGERILSEPTPDDAVEVAELLEKILDRLTEDQRKSLLLKIDGLSHAEIAAELGISTKTVQRRFLAIRQAAVAVLGRENIPDWLAPAQLSPAEEFLEYLNEPVSDWLSDRTQQLGTSPKRTLGQVLYSATPDVELLNSIRRVAKRRGAESNGDVSQLMCAAIYLLAISAARIRLGKNLSADPDAKLGERINQILTTQWLNQETRELFRLFLREVNKSN